MAAAVLAASVVFAVIPAGAATEDVLVGSGGNRFVPDEPEIEPGDTINFIPVVFGHNITIPDLGVNHDFDAAGNPHPVVFPDAGEFDFFCRFHPGMDGTAFVGTEPSSSSSSSSTSSSTTTTLPPPPLDVVSTFYFAEGTVRPGFVEFLTLQNPGPAPGTARLLFQASDDSGAAVPVESLDVALPGQSRRTVNVNDHVASRGVTVPVDVSVQVVSDQKILAERPLYFATSLAGGVDGGTDIIGTPSPSTFWTFAEGTARPGFQEFLTFQNPLTTTAGVTVTFQATDDSGNAVAVPQPLAFTLAAQSRVTKDVNAFLAAQGVSVPVDVSARVDSTGPIVVERPLYFRTDFSSVAPGLVGAVDGGTTVLGATSSSTSFYFAEGTVRAGFHEFVTLQNPAASGPDASVTLTFQTSGPVVDPLVIVVPAGSRRTVNVSAVAFHGLDSPLDVSLIVASTQPILAERPLYFSTGLAGGVDGGTDVVGAVAPYRTFDFAEGTVRPGFEEFLTFQNPATSGADAEVTVTFQAAGDDQQSVSVPPLVLSIAPAARATRSVNAHVAAAGITGAVDLSAHVASSQPIVAERSLYFRSPLAGGVDGGTDVIGYSDEVVVPGP